MNNPSHISFQFKTRLDVIVQSIIGSFFCYIIIQKDEILNKRGELAEYQLSPIYQSNQPKILNQ